MGRRKTPSSSADSIGKGYEWATKIITVALMMVGPAWLCERFLGRTPWTLAALLVGVTLGIVYLLWITGSFENRKDHRDDGENGE